MTEAIGEETDNKALAIYRRFRSGEDIHELAEKEGVSLKKAKYLVEQGQISEEIRLEQSIRIEKLEAQLDNEKIRRKARNKLQDKFVAAMEKLLDGKKILFSVDKLSGEILTKEVDDVESLAAGTEIYRKAISLEEKPAQAPTVVVQTVQNNNGGNKEGYSVESTLAKIKQKRKLSEAESNVVSITSVRHQGEPAFVDITADQPNGFETTE